jgi:DNA-directed RNA polymerase subunit M/transcription elongation factor TFIIS
VSSKYNLHTPILFPEKLSTPLFVSTPVSFLLCYAKQQEVVSNMGVDEIIVCSKCKGEDCRVDELREKEKISMEAYAHRHTFPQDIFSRFWSTTRDTRKFVITCQDCGYQKEFQERVIQPQVYLATEEQKELHDGS